MVVFQISANVPVVFVRTPSIQTRALLISGNPEQLVRFSLFCNVERERERVVCV